MPYVYILQCSDQSYYIGSTWNLEARVWAHNQGLGAAYTRHRQPVELVWFEETESISEAFGMEKQLQGWSHEKRRLLIEGGFSAVRGWSNRYREQRKRDTTASPGD